jgi:hypothetical protein
LSRESWTRWAGLSSKPPPTTICSSSIPGAGIGPATLHLLGLAHEIIVVATPNLAATLDAYGLIKCVHERHFPDGFIYW